MSEFKDKTAIITGAAIGIGFEIAQQLARRGGRIVLNDIDESALRIAQKKLIAVGGQCEIVAGSSAEITIIDQMIDTAIQAYGQLDFAIANAGITTYGDFLTYTVPNFQQLTSVNLQGSFFLAQRAARQMIQQKKGGRIIIMSSVTGHQAHKDLAAYGMTKAGLRHLTQCLAVELGPHQITVNALSPGATLTERTRALDDAFEEQWKKITPTQQVATPEDIAHACCFFLSEKAKQITGQTLVVDGGWIAYSPQPE